MGQTRTAVVPGTAVVGPAPDFIEYYYYFIFIYPAYRTTSVPVTQSRVTIRDKPLSTVVTYCGWGMYVDRSPVHFWTGPFLSVPTTVTSGNGHFR